MTARIYKCPVCGNVIVKLVDSGVDPVCCGQPMKLMEPKVTEEYNEKHLPVVCRTDDGMLQVRVGQVAHPMTAEHHIAFILAETQCGMQVCRPKNGQPAEAVFNDCQQEIKAVYAYCNLHGLWVCRDIPHRCCTVGPESECKKQGSSGNCVNE